MSTLLWLMSDEYDPSANLTSDDFHYYVHNNFSKSLQATRFGLQPRADFNGYKQAHNLFLFTIVRHPFARFWLGAIVAKCTDVFSLPRLVSAFESKILYPTSEWELKELREAVNGSFPKFIDYVLDEMMQEEKSHLVRGPLFRPNNHWDHYHNL